MKVELAILLFVLISVVHSEVKVDQKVYDTLKKKGKVNVLLKLSGSANFDKIRQANTLSRSKKDLGTEIVDELKRVAAEKQIDCKKSLKGEKKKYRSYWISNVVAVDDVNEEMMNKIKKRKDIVSVESNEPSKYKSDETLSKKPVKVNEKDIPNHIKNIKADKLWTKGIRGKDIVVGVASTGANHLHEALKSSYRGTKKDGSFSHDYNWFEAFSNGSPAPRDRFNIGTHLTGTVTGTAKHIGVAPSSKFISCKVIDDAQRETPEAQLKCLQFFLAPFDLKKSNPRPDLRPHVVLTSNCESCGSQTDTLRESVDALVAAGIAVISPSGGVKAGADKCAKILRPPAVYQKVLTVGALGDGNTRLPTSAAGPAIVNGKAATYNKPNVVAPGKDVLSSVYDFQKNKSLYFTASGSPVSGAVTAGAVALLWDAVPQLKRKVALTFSILEKSANTITSSQCSSKNPKINREFGSGSIDLVKAVALAHRHLRKACRDCFKKCRLLPCRRRRCWKRRRCFRKCRKTVCKRRCSKCTRSSFKGLFTEVRALKQAFRSFRKCFMGYRTSESNENDSII